MPLTTEQIQKIQSLNPEQKAQTIAEIQGELKRRQGGQSTGGRILSGLGRGLQAGLKALPYAIHNQIPPQDTTQQDVNKAMLIEQAKRSLPITPEEQANIEFTQAKTQALNAGMVNPEDTQTRKIELETLKADLDKQKEILKSELKGHETQIKMSEVQAKIRQIDTEIAKVEQEMAQGGQIAEKPLSVAQQKFNIQEEERKKRLEEKSKFVKESALDTINTIKEIKKGKDLFGLKGVLTPAIPGSRKADWNAELNKLLSGKVIDVMTRMKEASRTGATGFGQLSEKELAVLEGAATALKRNISPEKAEKLLTEMESLLEKVTSEFHYSTEQEAEAADLPIGTIIYINGIKAVIE